MVDINDLRRAGHSTTGRAWITNPTRLGMLAVVRPYLAELTREINALSAITAKQEDLDRACVRSSAALKEELQCDIAACVRSSTAVKEELQRDIAACLRSSTAVKEELQRASVLVDGLRKDQLASNHRLGSIEDEADSNQLAVEGLREQLLQLSRHIEAIQSPAAQVGMATLMPNQPLAIFGTSLVLHSGPYGRFLLRQPDLISDCILAGAFWDSHLKPVIERAGRSDRSAIDAGAYLGFHSAYMSRFFRVVHAFEPQVEIYRMLCANLLLNNCRNVVAVNAPLYDIRGYLRLADNTVQEIPMPTSDGSLDYDRIGNAAALTYQMTDESDSAAMATRTIDQLGLTDLALIKVDTQGSDLQVLRGACSTIQRCRPIITAEYERELTQGHGNTLDDYHRFFDEMSYDVQVLDNRGDGKQIDLLATPI